MSLCIYRSQFHRTTCRKNPRWWICLWPHRHINHKFRLVVVLTNFASIKYMKSNSLFHSNWVFFGFVETISMFMTMYHAIWWFFPSFLLVVDGFCANFPILSGHRKIGHVFSSHFSFAQMARLQVVEATGSAAHCSCHHAVWSRFFSTPLTLDLVGGINPSEKY